MDPSGIVGCGDVRCWTEWLARASEILALVAAGWWFLYTTQFKPRIQFDLGCDIKHLGGEAYLVEVLLTCENKGFVEHRLYDLTISVHGLGNAALEAVGPDDRVFTRRLWPKTTIVPRSFGWWFVRPGVRQVITHQLVLRNPGPFIEITAGFTYDKGSPWPHTARRVFTVAPSSSAHAGMSAPSDT